MRNLKLLSILLLCLFLSGCWDKVEIDRKIFVSTIGVDVGKDINKEYELKKENFEEVFPQKNANKLKVSFAFPDISDFSPNKASVKGDNVFPIDAYSMQGAIDEIAVKASRDLYLDHTRLLLLGSDLLYYPDTVKEVVDYIQRQPKLNRRLYVLIVEGKVDEVMNFNPPIDKHIQAYISGIMDNSNRNGTILPVTLNEFLVLLSENGNAILPTIKLDKEKNQLSLTGTDIIKNYSTKGHLDPVETCNLEILRGNLKGGTKVIYENGHPIDYEIDGIKREIKVNRKENKLIFNIKINLEGKLKGAYIGDNVFYKENIDSMENRFNKMLVDECEKVARYTKQEVKVDAIGLRENVEKYHPYIWNSVKDNWEEAFSNSQINIEVNTNIRRVGISK